MFLFLFFNLRIIKEMIISDFVLFLMIKDVKTIHKRKYKKKQIHWAVTQVVSLGRQSNGSCPCVKNEIKKIKMHVYIFVQDYLLSLLLIKEINFVLLKFIQRVANFILFVLEASFWLSIAHNESIAFHLIESTKFFKVKCVT